MDPSILTLKEQRTMPLKGYPLLGLSLLQESKVQYSEDPVVKYGFCRGIEPVTYVSVILERMDHYRKFVTS